MKLVTCLYEGKERVGALMERGVAFLPFPDMNTLIETADPARLTAGAGVQPPAARNPLGVKAVQRIPPPPARKSPPWWRNPPPGPAPPRRSP